MKKACAYLVAGFAVLLLSGGVPLPAQAQQGAVSESIQERDLEHDISRLSLNATAVATIILIALLLLTAATGKHEKLHTPVFLSMATVTILTTLLLVGSTVYLNTVSVSKGPVHWHADFEVWACGEQQELVDPTGFLSNKVGTPTLHEHNDGRIHLEGVVVKHEDASLGKFFRVVGGQLTSNSLVIPTTNGMRSFVSGQNCGQEPAELQVFVYKTSADKTYSQQKVSNPASYIIRDTPNVPPGDCIIVEFGKVKERTDHLCVQYRYAEQRGELKEAL